MDKEEGKYLSIRLVVVVLPGTGVVGLYILFFLAPGLVLSPWV